MFLKHLFWWRKILFASEGGFRCSWKFRRYPSRRKFEEIIYRKHYQDKYLMTCEIKYFSRLPEKIFMIRWDFWGFLLADVIANTYIGETETNVIIHLQLKLTTWRKNYNWADFWMRPMTSNTILLSTDRFAAHTSCKYANDAENLFLFLSENAGNATYTEYKHEKPIVSLYSYPQWTSIQCLYKFSFRRVSVVFQNSWIIYNTCSKTQNILFLWPCFHYIRREIF